MVHNVPKRLIQPWHRSNPCLSEDGALLPVFLLGKLVVRSGFGALVSSGAEHAVWPAELAAHMGTTCLLPMALVTQGAPACGTWTLSSWGSRDAVCPSWRCYMVGEEAGWTNTVGRTVKLSQNGHSTAGKEKHRPCVHDDQGALLATPPH